MVAFPKPGGANFEAFVKFDNEMKDALAVADLTWTRYTEDGIGRSGHHSLRKIGSL